MIKKKKKRGGGGDSWAYLLKLKRDINCPFTEMKRLGRWLGPGSSLSTSKPSSTLCFICSSQAV